MNYKEFKKLSESFDKDVTFVEVAEQIKTPSTNVAIIIRGLIRRRFNLVSKSIQRDSYKIDLIDAELDEYRKQGYAAFIDKADESLKITEANRVATYSNRQQVLEPWEI